MAETRIAVAGAGFWARYQIAAWHELPGSRVVAICDSDLAKAQALGSYHGIFAVYRHADEMLHAERPDLLDVITPPATHADLVRLAISRRVPVVCQKPMAPTWTECRELVTLADAAHSFFAVHENWRWQTPLRRVKELLDAGVAGRPFRCRIEMISGFDVFANQPALRSFPEFIIADMGCHLFDLARSWFGESSGIYCRTATVRHYVRGEDVATAVMDMNGGRTAVTVTMAYAGTPLERECFPQTLAFIEGDRGSIDLLPNYEIRVTDAAGTRIEIAAPPIYGWAEPQYAVVHSSMVPCVGNILDSLRSGRRAETDAADNLQSMRLVFAAYESSRTGNAVQLRGGQELDGKFSAVDI